MSHPPLRGSALLAPLTLLLAACAPSARGSAPSSPREYVAHASADADRCGPNGRLVVKNGESFGVDLVATSYGSPIATNTTQRLGSLAPGATDTLVDLRSDVRFVHANAGAAHSGPPMQGGPKRVRFTCAVPQGE